MKDELRPTPDEHWSIADFYRRPTVEHKRESKIGLFWRLVMAGCVVMLGVVVWRLFA
jgi:hypothetical protein